jgi:Contractile injection system tube protein
MPGGFSNKPKILRGAFVEFGISLPPLVVVFQFNPLSISRTRTASVEQPRTPRRHGAQNLTLLQQVTPDSLKDVRGKQLVRVNDETLSFDIRLDATDKLDAGDALTEEFGITPQLSTLELMMLPKGQGLLGAVGSALLGAAGSKFSFADDAKNPPVILFVWGRKKVMPVNIIGMQIKEEEFSFDLNPTRATVSVSLQVIEGPNAPFLYTEAMKEAMSLTNLANLGDISNTIVPA